MELSLLRVERGEAFALAARGGYPHQSAVVSGENNAAIFAPASPEREGAIAESDRGSTGHRNFLERFPVAREIGEPLSVGRKEGTKAPLGSRDRFSLRLIQHADPDAR